MKLQYSKIPNHIIFLGEWLYQFRKIYDLTDENREEDWSEERKDERIKLLSE